MLRNGADSRKEQHIVLLGWFHETIRVTEKYYYLHQAGHSGQTFFTRKVLHDMTLKQLSGENLVFGTYIDLILYITLDCWHELSSHLPDKQIKRSDRTTISVGKEIKWSSVGRNKKNNA